MNWKAAKTSALLCLLFLAVYGAINRLTGLRSDVGTCYAEWERSIPFVPAMIVPYMSIDLFFIAAPFVCRDDRERRKLLRRIIAAILISGICFLLFPLRFAFERQHVDGPLGLIFNNFRHLDQPFNQFPSLHIALQIILLALYGRHMRGIARVAVTAWFVLIGASTLLTYQHHSIDVIGGVALGTLCVHLFQDEPVGRPVVRNARVGMYYLIGAIALVGAAIALRPWGLLALWPAMSMGLVSAGYFRFGAGVFRKRDGVLPATTQVLLWPVLLGQRISLAYYARQARAWDAITDHLWISRQLSNDEARQAIDLGVTAVLDLTVEFSEARAFRSITYRQLPVLDLTAPTQEQLNQAVTFIRAHAERGIVCVHCKAGYSRTAAVAGAFLLATGEVGSVEEAVTKLRVARPQIVIRPEAMQALREFADRLPVETTMAAPATPSLAFAGAPSPR